MRPVPNSESSRSVYAKCVCVRLGCGLGERDNQCIVISRELKLIFETEGDGTVISYNANVDTGFTYFVVPPTGKSITATEVSETQRDSLGG